MHCWYCGTHSRLRLEAEASPPPARRSHKSTDKNWLPRPDFLIRKLRDLASCSAGVSVAPATFGSLGSQHSGYCPEGQQPSVPGEIAGCTCQTGTGLGGITSSAYAPCNELEKASSAVRFRKGWDVKSLSQDLETAWNLAWLEAGSHTKTASSKSTGKHFHTRGSISIPRGHGATKRSSNRTSERKAGSASAAAMVAAAAEHSRRST